MEKYLSNISLEDGLKLYIQEILEFKNIKTELLDVDSCLNRITSKAVFANLSSPFYNCSAMDGIAVKSNKTFCASEQNIITLNEDLDYVEVDTGDYIPKEFDSVIMVEDLLEKKDGKVKIYKPAIPWQHIRCIGEDIVESEMIVPSYHKIKSQDVASMVSAKVDYVEVFKEFKVGIIPTGTELIDRKKEPKLGDIIEFNSRLFKGLVLEYGAVGIVYPIVEDNYEKIKESVVKALDECDMVLINAGSSQGREDYTYSVINDLGRVVLHGMAIKPGKPVILGHAKDKPVIGIPGYPVSGWVVMDNVVKEVISKLTNNEKPLRTTINARLTKRIISSLKYKEFIRVKVGNINGEYVATPIKRGAGTITSLVNADGIIKVEQNIEGIEQGSIVKVELLNDIRQIDKTIVSIGSHDIVMDYIDDELRKKSNGNFKLSSTHVGSFQGILSVKNNECHIAPIHLFDIETETYNKTYVRKYIDDDVSLIKFISRKQGLIVKKGNPLNIKGISDLVNVRFINRQKGSGTRVLLDYLIQKENIKKSCIKGYEREELTHMSLAKAIQNNDCDCGLGVYSVAKVFDLDFIPICEEEYDLLVKNEMLGLDSVKYLIETIKDRKFIEKIEQLGGYSTQNIGKVIKL